MPSAALCCLVVKDLPQAPVDLASCCLLLQDFVIYMLLLWRDPASDRLPRSAPSSTPYRFWPVLARRYALVVRLLPWLYLRLPAIRQTLVKAKCRRSFLLTAVPTSHNTVYSIFYMAIGHFNYLVLSPSTFMWLTDLPVKLSTLLRGFW